MKEQLEDKEIKYIRGKVAHDDVCDGDGNVVVTHGQTIDDSDIQRARDAGQLHFLMISAVSSVVEEGGERAKQRLQEFRGLSGHEENYVRGKQAGRDAHDSQGNLILREGEMVTDDVIHRAKESGGLQDLVMAVGAPGLHMDEACACPACGMGYVHPTVVTEDLE